MNQKSPYRYVICACCTGLLFINMGLISTAFTAYFPYMREIKGYTNTQLYLMPSIRSVSAIVFTLFSELYYRKMGIRRGVLLALSVTAGGFFLLAAAPSFLVYELCMILFGFSYAIGATIPSSVLIRQWFPEHSAGIMGIVTAGSGISFVFTPMYINHFVGIIGLDRTLLLEAVSVVVLSAVLILLIREAPQSAAAASAAGKASGPTAPEAELTRSQLVRLFIFFFVVGCLALTAVSGLSMLYSTTGHTKELAAEIISAFGFSLILGKILYGVLCEKLGSYRTNFLYCCFMTIGMILCCLAQDAPKLLLLCSAWVFSFGCALASVGLTVISGDMSTAASYRKTLKNLQFIYSLGGLVSGTLPGIIADLTGSYIPAYYIFLALSLTLYPLLLPLYKGRH